MRTRFNSSSSGLVLTAAIMLTAVVATPASTLAQVRGEGGISLVVGSPQGQFNSQVDATGFGINAFGGVRFGRNSPVLLGLDLGFLIYGRERRSEAFSLTIPDVRVDVITSNNIVLSHFLVRFQPARGPVRPYFDGLVGFKYLFTETRIQDQTYLNDEPIATTTNFDDVALSYGVGGGLSIAVARTGSGGRRGTISLDLGVRYLLGGEASYLKRGSIQRSGGRVSYDVYRSETNILETRIGASVRF